MFRSLRFAGFLLSSLTVATVALSQQSARNSLVEAGSQAISTQPAKARLARAAESRDAQVKLPALNACGDGRPALDRNGREIRRICTAGLVASN